MAIIDPREHGHLSLPAGEDSRWHEVWQLVIAAECRPLAERRDFLLAADADAFVIRQAMAIVEGSASMASHASMARSTPPAGDERFVPESGMRLGRYRVGALLGSGATGSVHAGVDEELNRAVAIKFFSPRRHAAADIRARPLREARAASALNHPNIIMIHEVVETGDAAAIVMELVPGVTLRALAGTSPPLGEILHWSGQLANALAVAHANHLVHGDIKPENVMVRDDGYIKLLDFGLALDALPDSRNGPFLTGTPRYMSPEQCLGRAATPASDIFAFGVMLYELTTGQHPFRADGMLGLLQAIISADPPPPISLNPKLPSALNTLILRMLAKQSEDRLTAYETAEQLAAIRARLSTRRPLVRMRITVASALFAVAILSWVLFRRNSSPDLTDLNIQPLTSQWGWERSPAISPDGRSVALTRADTPDRPEQIYVKLRNAEGLRQVTSSARRDRIGSLVWSPDGKQIAFKRSEEPYNHPGAIYSVSSDGGPERKIVELSNANLSSSIDWSPDGTQLAYSDAVADELGIYLFNVQTGHKRRLITPPKGIWGDWDPRFSPDGAQIAFKRVEGNGADEIYLTNVAGGPIRRAVTGVHGIWGHAWMPNGKSLIVACERGGAGFNLWRFPLVPRSGAPQRLLQGGALAITPSTNRKTNLIAWVNEFEDANIYRVSAKGNSPPEKLIASPLSEQDGAYSPTSRIAFTSNRSGSREIWISDAEGSVQGRVTDFKASLVKDLQWSHDGRRLACEVRTHWIPSVFLLNCSSQNAHCDAASRLSSWGPAEVPSWSADDRFLYFASNRSGRSEIYREAVEGGPLKQVTHNGGYTSRESADGKWLYFSKPEIPGVWRMALVPSRGKSASAEGLMVGPPYRPASGRWTLAGDEIVFIDRALNNQPAAIRAYNIAKRRARLILTPLPPFDTTLSVSPDLRWVLYTHIDESGSNVMLAETMK